MFNWGVIIVSRGWRSLFVTLYTLYDIGGQTFWGIIEAHCRILTLWLNRGWKYWACINCLRRIVENSQNSQWSFSNNTRTVYGRMPGILCKRYSTWIIQSPTCNGNCYTVISNDINWLKRHVFIFYDIFKEPKRQWLICGLFIYFNGSFLKLNIIFSFSILARYFWNPL